MCQLGCFEDAEETETLLREELALSKHENSKLLKKETYKRKYAELYSSCVEAEAQRAEVSASCVCVLSVEHT